MNIIEKRWNQLIAIKIIVPRKYLLIEACSGLIGDTRYRVPPYDFECYGTRAP